MNQAHSKPTAAAKSIGIVAHSAEGASLCFLTACHEGSRLLGPHMHPTIVLSAVPMALSMEGWKKSDYGLVAEHLKRGVQLVTDAGADFYVCPDNTAHLVLEQTADSLPLPGLHIAQVVCREIARQGWRRVGLLGTKWTMTGSVYSNALKKHEMERLVPDESTRERLNSAIFDELCRGTFTSETTALFVHAIQQLKDRGAECVILGCTEIPLIITPTNSPLPTLDSTRLLAKYAVAEAVNDTSIAIKSGWLQVRTAPEPASTASTD
ncbi:MAG: amino acid racemase [Planctomycetes bacterium]|nr:amino acid racemase [Planctomycetota bacterium]